MDWSAVRTTSSRASREKEGAATARTAFAVREAGHNVASVCPRALAGRNATGFITAEATRFVNQIARRIQRRWGPFTGLQLATAEGRAVVTF